MTQPDQSDFAPDSRVRLLYEDDRLATVLNRTGRVYRVRTDDGHEWDMGDDEIEQAASDEEPRR